MTPLNYIILETAGVPVRYGIGYQTKYCRVIKYGPFGTEQQAISCLERIKKDYREKLTVTGSLPELEAKQKLCLEFWRWQYRREHYSNFTILLFDLIAKADSFNTYRLSLAFPSEVAIHKEWMDAPTENSIYAVYNIDWQTGHPINGVAAYGN